MNTKYLIRQSVALCSLVVFVIVQSMVVFAAIDKNAGNLTVINLASNSEKSIVKVNGEPAATGRSIFSSSLIETSDTSGAVISAGKLGKIELAANSKFIVSFDNNAISGNLTAGNITVLDSLQAVNITADGQLHKLNAGESAAASDRNSPASSSAKTKIGRWGWLPWTFIVIGGAAAALIVSAAVGSNDLQIGNSVGVISPTR